MTRIFVFEAKGRPEIYQRTVTSTATSHEKFPGKVKPPSPSKVGVVTMYR